MKKIIIIIFLSFSFLLSQNNLLNKFESSLEVDHPNLAESIIDLYGSIDSPIFEYECENSYSSCCCDKELTIGLGGLLYIGVSYIISSPFWAPLTINNYDPYSDNFGYDTYRFFDSKGIYKSSGNPTMLNSNVSYLNMSDGISGSKINIDYIFHNRFAFEGSHVQLRDKNDSKTRKISDGIISYVFAKDDLTDFRVGIGITNFKGNSHYNGVKMFYGIRTFFKPCHYELNIGYSNLGDNYILDLGTSLSFHSQEFDIKLGYRSYKTSEYTIQGPELSLGYWF